MKTRVIIGLLASAFILLNSCDDTNRLEVSLPTNSVVVDVTHFDQLLFIADSAEREEELSLLTEKEQALFKVLVENIMRISAVDDPYMMHKFDNFLQEPHWRELQLSVDSVFYPFDDYHEKLSEAFSYYQYHFPADTIPVVFTYNSGFNYGIYPDDNFIGVGLEWYVGSNNKIVKQLPYDAFPNYIKAHMQPQFMAVDAIKGWLLIKHFKDELLQASFLENMMFYGKVMYYVDACFPYETDDIKMGYAPDEIAWVISNEKNIWATIVKEKMLFENDTKVQKQWFVDAPFTAGLPQESPGKVGIWLGWQMVKQYMDENHDVSLQELSAIKAETILKNYKPNK